MQFLLWFEPERVGDPNSWLGKNHPEWLMPGNSAGDVLNLGDPAALQWLIEHMDGLVKSQGLDWYREDLNGAHYGTAWRNADAPDRQGITENFHVQGHLAFWDELRRRNPHLHIDSCASGGRRNDLETMRRAVPLLRSDWSVTAFAKEPLQIEGNQAQTYGLSSWLPWQGVGVPFFTDRYAVPQLLRHRLRDGLGRRLDQGREQASRDDSRLHRSPPHRAADARRRLLPAHAVQPRTRPLDRLAISPAAAR